MVIVSLIYTVSVLQVTIVLLILDACFVDLHSFRLQMTIVLLILNGYCFVDQHCFCVAGDYRIVDTRHLLFR